MAARCCLYQGRGQGGGEVGGRTDTIYLQRCRSMSQRRGLLASVRERGGLYERAFSYTHSLFMSKL